MATRYFYRGEPKVAFMIRRVPSEPGDSGWWFYTGLESAEYAADLANFDRFALRSIAEIDPDVLPFLEAPVGSIFDRNDETGRLESVVSPEENTLFSPGALDAGLHPAYPAVEGVQPLSGGWSFRLPGLFNRREEGHRLAFGRPGLTAFVTVVPGERPATARERLDHVKRSLPSPPAAFEEIRDGRCPRLALHSVEPAVYEGEARPMRMLYGWVCGEAGCVDLQILADDEAAAAREIWLSVDHAGTG